MLVQCFQGIEGLESWGARSQGQYSNSTDGVHTYALYCKLAVLKSREEARMSCLGAARKMLGSIWQNGDGPDCMKPPVRCSATWPCSSAGKMCLRALTCSKAALGAGVSGSD